MVHASQLTEPRGSKRPKHNDWFNRMRQRVSAAAQKVTRWAGGTRATLTVVSLIVVWHVFGAVKGFPEWWHTWYATVGNSIILVMLFVLQHTANRHAQAEMLKLDELVRVDREARNEMIEVEKRPLDEQEQLEEEVSEIADRDDREGGAPAQPSTSGDRAGMAVSRTDLPTIDDLTELRELVDGGSDVFLRFSRGPGADADSPSRDYESDLELPGLSVTPLDPPDWWERPVEDWLARQICKYIDIAEKAGDRKAWVLGGREVSRGPDHEPIVVDVEPFAWLGDTVLSAARDRYHERFAVGESSIGDDSGASREST